MAHTMAKIMTKTIPEAVRELCLNFPDTQEVISHGFPNFRVAGKTFATFTVNHHGDERVALNVASPSGAQQLHTEMEPEYYFVPPYVGPKGWLGIELNKGLDWKTIANRVREAWDNVAPGKLAKTLDKTPEIKAPNVEMSAEDINPFLQPRSVEIMNALGERCSLLPESNESLQFGNPTWKAGKKTYVTSHHHAGRLSLQFWVGADQQAMLALDERYSIPAYTGHNGWINLDVQVFLDWQEVEALLRQSYRHFALKRMLKELQ